VIQYCCVHIFILEAQIEFHPILILMRYIYIHSNLLYTDNILVKGMPRLFINLQVLSWVAREDS